MSKETLDFVPPLPPKNYKISSAFSYNFISALTVTNDGAEMLNEWMAGRKITITSAYGGTGTVDPELLTEQTGLVDMRQKLHLLGEEDGADGKTVQVQLQNAEVMTEYSTGPAVSK